MTIQFYIFTEFFNVPDLMNFHGRKKLSINQIFAANRGAPNRGMHSLYSSQNKKKIKLYFEKI